MSKLQQALSQVKAPKVDVRQAVQGAQYRGAEQQAQQVRQNDYTGQLLKITGGAAELGNKYVDKRWEEAEKTYTQAKAQGLDPASVIAEKAKTESATLGQTIMSGLFDKDGADPLAYTRALTANREMQQAQFDIAQELNNRIKAGDITDENTLNAERTKLLDGEAKGISEGLGINSNSAFILEGRTAEFEATTRVLHETLFKTADEKMRTDRKQIFTKDTNLLFDQGVTDPAVYMQRIEGLEAEGTINSAREKFAYIGDLVNRASATGRVDLVNGLLNQTTTLNGQTAKLGELLDPELRDKFILKAAEQRFNMDAELSDQYNRQMGEIAALSLSNPAAALQRLDSLGEWYSKSSGTTQMTSQRQQMQQTRNSLLVAQARENIETKQRLQAAAQQADEVSIYNKEIDKALASGGDFVTLEPERIGVKGANANLAINKRISGIQEQVQAGALSQEDGLRQVNTLLARLPASTQAGAGYQQGLQRQADSLQHAIVMSQNGLAQKEVPAPYKNLMGLYKTDPVSLSKVMSPDKMLELSVNAETIELFGGEAYMQMSSNAKPFTQDQTKDVDTVIEKSLPYANAAQGAAISKAAQLLSQRNGGDHKEATKMAIEMWNKNHGAIEVGNGMTLPNRVLTPNRDPSLQPVVISELQTTVQQFKDNNPNSGLVTVEEHGNKIRIMSYPDLEFYDTDADTLLEGATQRKVEGEMAKRKAFEQEAVERKAEQEKKTAETLAYGRQMAESFRPEKKTKAEKDQESSAMAQALGNFGKK